MVTCFGLRTTGAINAHANANNKETRETNERFLEPLVGINIRELNDFQTAGVLLARDEVETLNGNNHDAVRLVHGPAIRCLRDEHIRG